ncbi:MAG: flagellar motor switch protein FliM [Bacilli bacterium]
MSSEVLSQNEIDALLAAISTGEMDADELKKEQTERRVKTYDFKRALRFSKDHIRSITRIHENYARLLTTYFSAQLRTFVQISVASVDQIPYEEFIRSIPKMTILNIFELPPLEGQIVMEVNPNIAYSMLDRLLGGSGKSYNKIDSLTEIENKIMRGLFERAGENYSDAWQSIVEFEPMLTEFEVNPQFMQMVNPNETVIVISLSTTIGETSGIMNICIPHVVLEPILPGLSTHFWMQKEKRSSDKTLHESIASNVKTTKVPVIAEVGTSSISFYDLLHLEVGDVLELNQKIDSPIVVRIDDKNKFIAQPGKKNRKLAVQILGDYEGGKDHDE